jgi:hypothetical protein
MSFALRQARFGWPLPRTHDQALRTIKHFDSLYLTVMVLFGASLIADLFWTRREVGRLARNETRLQKNSSV